MKTVREAKNLGVELKKIGNSFDIDVNITYSNMSQPLGEYAGLRCEIIEAINCLRGDGPDDVIELTLELCANILIQSGTSKNKSEAKKILLKNFSNYDEEPLYLVDNNKSIFSYDIPVGRNSVINSADLNYTYQIIKPGSEVILSGIIDEQRSLDLKFKLDKDSSLSLIHI